VELVGLLLASSEGVPAAARTHSVIVLITVQGLLRITNRAGKSGFSKEQLLLNTSSVFKMFSRNFFKKNCGGGN